MALSWHETTLLIRLWDVYHYKSWIASSKRRDITLSRNNMVLSCVRDIRWLVSSQTLRRIPLQDVYHSVIETWYHSFTKYYGSCVCDIRWLDSSNSEMCDIKWLVSSQTPLRVTSNELFHLRLSWVWHQMTCFISDPNELFHLRLEKVWDQMTCFISDPNELFHFKLEWVWHQMTCFISDSKECDIRWLVSSQTLVSCFISDSYKCNVTSEGLLHQTLKRVTTDDSFHLRL